MYAIRSYYDAGSSVTTRYSVDGGPEQVYSVPFFLSQGGHTLTFHSTDAAGNQEDPPKSEIVV